MIKKPITDVEKKVYIKIENEGEIDVNGLSIIGASSKREDESKIGFFGSGNKYAMALLLREKIPFKIFSGTVEVKITTKPLLFREKLYNQIYVNGEKTSLTTDMGPDWEPWFAVREFYCNALDEGGETLGVSDKRIGTSGKTTLYIEMVDSLKLVFEKRNHYFLTASDKPKNTASTCYGDVSIYQADGPILCYRKGIRIMPKGTVQKSLFWYNFDSIQINESRTYKYEHEVRERIASYFTNTKSKPEIETYLSSWKGAYEELAMWEYASDKLSGTWHDILFGHRVYPEKLAVDSGDYEGKRNSFIVPNALAKKIADQFPDIEVVGYKNDKHFVEVEPTSGERIKLDTAKKELASIGYDITIPIKLAITTTDDVVAWYDKEGHCIYHTRKYLTSVKEIKNTLLEEWFHHNGQVDGQRTFVTFLIDEIINRSL